MRKMTFRWLLALVVVLPCLVLTALATERAVVASGYCGGERDGTNLTWTLYEDGELVIAGTGAMGDSAIYNGPWAAYKERVEKATIEEGVTTIGACTFVFHDVMKDVTIPNSVVNIGKSAFMSCRSLDSIVIPDSVTSIEESAFQACYGVTSVVLGNGVTNIGKAAFGGCDMAALTLPDSVTSIGELAFNGCKSLTAITIPGSVASIGDSAFSCCYELATVVIEKGVTQIGNQAFFVCEKLVNVVVPDSVTKIGERAFQQCNRLNRVTIGAGVTNIGNSAFGECGSLKRVDFLGDKPFLDGEDIFDANTGSLIMYYREGAAGWPADDTWLGRPLVMLADVGKHKTAGTVPILEGKLFSGWYTDGTFTSVYTKGTGEACAKFADANVLTVKAQITSGTTAESAAADIRFVTTVDGLHYKRVGFKITFGDTTIDKVIRTVYSSIISKNSGVEISYTPTVFSGSSKYFATYVLAGVPNSKFNDEFIVTPYWITQDGTVVEGVTNRLSISTGY